MAATSIFQAQAWRERLEHLDVFEQVGFASDLPAALEDLRRCPSGFILSPRFDPQSPASSSGVFIQAVTVRVPLIYIAEHYADPTGEKGRAQLDELRTILWGGILGWTYGPQGQAVRLGASNRLGFNGSRQVLQDTYIYEAQLRVTT